MDIFTYAFFIRALIGGILIGVMAPMIGIYVVLRRLSPIGDTLAHISIAGVALGFLIQVYPLAIGICMAVLGALSIEFLRKTYKGYAELSIAILMSGGVALASILFTIGKGFNMNVTSYLFGSILTLNNTDLLFVLLVTIVVYGFVTMFKRELFLLTFDEDAAGVSGLPTKWLNGAITILTALVVSVAIKIVGALLISALLTIPVACSMVLGRSYKQTIAFSILFSEIAVLIGLSLAGIYNLAPGGMVVLTLIGCLIVLLIGKKMLRY
jgi:zinc transport system permease protein